MASVGDKGTRFNHHFLEQGAFSVGDKATKITIGGKSRLFSGSASVGDRVKVITYNGRRHIIAAPGPIYRTVSWGYSYADHIATDGEYVYCSFSNTKQLVKLDLNLKFISAINLGYVPYDITADGEYVYITKSGNIKKYNRDTLVESLSISSDADYGICETGSYLYTIRTTTGAYRIYKRNKSDLSLAAQSSIASPYKNVLATDGEYLYTLDSGKMKKRSLTDFSVISESTPPVYPSFMPGIDAGPSYLYTTYWNGSLTPAIYSIDRWIKNTCVYYDRTTFDSYLNDLCIAGNAIYCTAMSDNKILKLKLSDLSLLIEVTIT